MQDKIVVSQCLEHHPILNDTNEYKKKYISVLEYFVKKYSKDDIYSNAILKLYKQKFFADPIEQTYIYDAAKMKKAAKGVSKYKFKGFKLFTNRYALIFDCLYINAFLDETKGREIMNEIREIYNARYHKKLELFYQTLYFQNQSAVFCKVEYLINCWNINKHFVDKKKMRVLITANMSAGKSTLINALIGKKVTLTRNDVCTSKVHYIYNKPYEDQLISELDNGFCLNTNQSILMTNNTENQESSTLIGTYFRTINFDDKRVCLIDTPGVNSSLNIEHKKLTHKEISSNQYDRIIYVFNGENVGNYDDQKFLCELRDMIGGAEIIFVLNKIDRYKKGEDSVLETVIRIKEELINIGYENPVILPISAYAALLAKRYLYDGNLSEEEYDELHYFIMKFNYLFVEISGAYQSDYRKLEAKGYPDYDESDKIAEKCKKLLEYSGIEYLERVLFA